MRAPHERFGTAAEMEEPPRRHLLPAWQSPAVPQTCPPWAGKPGRGHRTGLSFPIAAQAMTPRDIKRS